MVHLHKLLVQAAILDVGDLASPAVHEGNERDVGSLMLGPAHLCPHLDMRLVLCPTQQQNMQAEPHDAEASKGSALQHTLHQGQGRRTSCMMP